MAQISGRSALSAGLAAGLLSAGLFFAGVFEPLETKLYDRWVRDLPSATPPEEIITIEVGRWAPEVLADAVTQLEDAGAEAIVMNEPAPSGPAATQLAEAAKSHGNVIFAARFGPEQVSQARDGKIPSVALMPGDDYIQGAAAVAFVNRHPDPDGVLRRFTPLVGEIPEVGYAAGATSRSQIELPHQAPSLGRREVFGPGPSLLIAYRMLDGSASDLASALSAPGSVRGKTVILSGNTSSMWRTPIGPMSDAQVTWQIASALAQGRGITRAPALMVAFVVVVVSVAMTLGAGRSKPLNDVLLPAGVAAIVWFLAGFAVRNGTWVDVIPMTLALVLGTALVAVFRWAAARAVKERQLLGRTLLEVLVHSCIAEVGCFWARKEGGLQTVAARGDVQLHLMSVIPEKGVVEVSRDEGNVVGIAISGWMDGGIVIVRPHSARLTAKRIEVLQQIVEAASRAATSEGGGARAVRRLLDEIVAMVDDIDHFPADHHDRISAICEAVGEKLLLSDRQIEALRDAARLHDLGKVGVPDRIIDSTGRLSEDEYARVKRHSELGAAILAVADMPKDLIEAVRGHHERWDGRGYPNKLQGGAIPMESRVLALADAVMSLVSDRPYRRGTSLSNALGEIANQRGKMFDPQMVEALVELAIQQPQLFEGSKAPV